MSLLWLPAEIQLLTLTHLSFHDVMHCRAVCRHLRALVDSSKELAFTLELGAAGTIENANCPDPKTKKVEKLWQSNKAWANLHWLCRRNIALPGTGRFFDVSEGLFFHTAAETDFIAGNGTTIEWFKLPSRREPNPSYMPEKIVFDVPLAEFAVDSTRNLLIGVELTGFRTNRHHTIICNLHARSISTNEIHPDAARPVLSCRFVSPVADFEPVAQICGNHIGVLLARKFGVTNPDSFDMFLLLDWTTGVSKASMGCYEMEEFWETFCFLTTDSVLIPSACNSLLNVYYFDNTPDSLKHEVSLLLPEPLTRHGLRHIYLRSQPSPSSSTCFAHPTGDNPPFTADPDEAIIILSLDYQYYMHGVTDCIDEGHNLPQVVAIPRRILTHFAHLARTKSTLLMSSNEQFHGRAYLAGISSTTAPRMSANACCPHEKLYMHVCDDPRYKRSPHIHADQWIRHTRWALDAVTPSLGCYAYGSRYIGMSSWIALPNAPASSVALYDFNLRNERRGHDLDEENIRPYPESEEDFNEDEDWDYNEDTGEKRWPVYDSRLVIAPNTINVPQVFKKPFTTTLPYRVIETEMMLAWDSAVLDGERIIGLQFMDYDAGSISALDVIVV